MKNGLLFVALMSLGGLLNGLLSIAIGVKVQGNMVARIVHTLVPMFLGALGVILLEHL